MKIWNLTALRKAFQFGIKANGWKLEKALKALWKLFNDSPAQSDLYIQFNLSDVFQLMFCQTCWFEDEPIAIQAMEV